MKKPTKLLPIEILEDVFSYDPVTGVLYRSTGSPVNVNDRTTKCLKIKVGRKTITVARLCWALFYRKDPGNKIIKHINGDPYDNRIENLRAVKPPAAVTRL